MSETLREAVARAYMENDNEYLLRGFPKAVPYRTPAPRHFDEADFAIKRVHQWLTERGWAVVPREATEGMKDACESVVILGRGDGDYNDYLGAFDGEKGYNAMVRNAPVSPLMEEGK